MTSADEKSFSFIKSTVWLYLLTLLTYTPFIINFLWGNHDWEWVQKNTPLFSGVFEGRFSQFILQTILFDKNILPILTVMTAFLFFTLSTILLFKLWEIPPKQIYFILLGLNLTCSPYTLSWLYFAFIILSNLTWPLCIFIGYYCLNKMTDSKQKILLFSSAVTLFTLVLGGYPPVINLIGITLFTLVLNDLCLKRLTPKSLIQKYTPHVLAIIISLIIFLFILHLLKTYGLQKETYNTAGIMLSEVFQKLLFCCSTAIKQFFVTHNFITYGYKYIGLCLFLLSLCRLFAQMPKTASYLITFALSIVGLLGATTATLFIAENVPQVLYAPRIDFFSLIYVYTFSAGVLLKSSTPFIRNLTFITLAALFFYNIKTTAEAEKSWQAGFIAETSFAERFLSRLEENPHFSANKGYTFVQGGTFDLRSRYYTAAKTNFTDSYTLSAPYIPWHLPSKAYRFYYPNNFFIEDFDIYWSYVNHKKLNLNDKLINYLSKDAMAWPSKDAVYMDEYTIILTLTPTGKELAREWINNLF